MKLVAHLSIRTHRPTTDSDDRMVLSIINHYFINILLPSSNFSLVFTMTENEVASSELFAETLIVQNILERACDKIEQEISRIPENEFSEVFITQCCIQLF